MADENPLKKLSLQERAEWIDLIANCGTGEMLCVSQTGAEDHHIAEIMLDEGYDKCTRCDWWEEVAFCTQVAGECVCNDCLEEGEEEDD